MNNPNFLRSNYLGVKNLFEKCECQHIHKKCSVDVNRISMALDAYYVKFQKLQNIEKKYHGPNNIISFSSKEETASNFNISIQPLTIFSVPDKVAGKFASQKRKGNEMKMPQDQLNNEAEMNSSSSNTLYDGEKNMFHNVKHSKRYHGLVVKSIDRPYRCSECGMAFKRNLHLKRHFMVSHSSKKNFSCSECGKLFSRKDYLDKHVSAHQKKKFKLKLLQQGVVVRTKMHVSNL